LEIRQITEADAAAWWALRLRALRESPEAFGSTYDEAVGRPLAVAARRALPDPDAPDNFTLGAFAPELVGFVGFEREEGRKNRHKGSIWGMFVAPESRGRGIARDLLAALVARERQQRAALAALGAAVAAYALFVFVYWHYERRYALFLVPWGALLGAAGLWWLHDRLAETRGRALGGLAALVLVGAILVPQGRALADDWGASLRVPGSVVVAEWIRDNTPGDAVVMTRNPWELSFHSGHQAVMIPYDDLDTIEVVARRYGVTYLQLDHLPDGKQLRPALAPLYDGRELPGFRKVYAGPDAAEPLVLVYQLTGAGR
jgi:GNAT superfamily N-acetyltransferase